MVEQWITTHIGTVASLLLMAVMLLCALAFAWGGPKMARFVSGFGQMPPQEQQQYDRQALCRAMRNLYGQLGLLLAVGAALSLLWQWLAALGFAAWLVRFFREVRLDEREAFAKYKR